MYHAMFNDRRSNKAKTTVSTSQLERLARSREVDVRRAVALNPNTPERLLLLLAGDSDLHVRCAVGQNKGASQRCLELLATGLGVESLSVAKNPMCSPELLDDLACRDREKRSSRVQRASELNDYADNAPNLTVRDRVNAFTIASHFLTDAPISVAIARNSSTDVKTLRFMAQDHSPEVRAAILWNPKTPSDLARYLALDWSEDAAVVAAGDRKIDNELIHVLSRHSNSNVRARVVKNPSTPQELLEAMAQDPSITVRAAVAGNPRTPDHILLALASDPDREVRRSVSGNKMSDLDILVKASQDSPSDSIAEQLFWNTFLSMGGPSLKGLVRQFKVDHYRLDFALPELRIGIEIDGLAFHSDQRSFTRDRVRERQLEMQGWRILRFAASEVLHSPEKCVSEASHWIISVT